MDKQSEKFISSLEELTCNDLAPKSKKKPAFGDLFWRIGGFLLAFTCLGVAAWSSSRLAENLFDFITAEEEYDHLANEFSPVTGVLDKSLSLKLGKESYPLPLFEQIKDGNAVYPDGDEPPFDLPVINPGTEPTPSTSPNPPVSLTPTPSPSIPPVSPSEPVEPPSTEPSPSPPLVEPTPTPTPTPVEPEEPEEDPLLSSDMFESFCEKLTSMQGQYKNKDIFAWIYIPGTNINYPIVKGADNDYYLDRDVSKKWNTAGSIYLDYRNNKNLLKNPFSVIYGHNIRTKGIMFNRLIELLEEENYDRCRYIYIYTKEAALKYEIFSVYSADASESPTLSIPTQNSAAFLRKIQDIQNNSIHRPRNITLYESDHVVLLYTCSNTQSPTERVFVAGVLVGIGY